MPAEIPLPKDPRHQRFADLVLAGERAPDAYRAAGFPPVGAASVHTLASRLLKKVEVSTYMQAMRQQAAVGLVASMQQKRELLYRIMFTPLRSINPNDPAFKDGDLIKKYKRVVTETGETEEIEKLDPLKAMDLDNKLSGDDPEAKALGDLAGVLARLAPASVIPTGRL